MKCDHVVHNIDSFVRDELDDSTRTEIASHISDCSACALEESVARDLAKNLRLLQTAAPSDLADKIVTEVKSMDLRSKKTTVITPYKSIAALVIIGIAIWFTNADKEMMSPGDYEKYTYLPDESATQKESVSTPAVEKNEESERDIQVIEAKKDIVKPSSKVMKPRQKRREGSNVATITRSVTSIQKKDVVMPIAERPADKAVESMMEAKSVSDRDMSVPTEKFQAAPSAPAAVFVDEIFAVPPRIREQPELEMVAKNVSGLGVELSQPQIDNSRSVAAMSFMNNITPLASSSMEDSDFGDNAFGSLSVVADEQDLFDTGVAAGGGNVVVYSYSKYRDLESRYVTAFDEPAKRNDRFNPGNNPMLRFIRAVSHSTRD